jgi:hypothetical protein
MIFATGFSNPEGPVVLPDGTWLIVEGGAGRGCVTHVSAGDSLRTASVTSDRVPETPRGLPKGRGSREMAKKYVLTH